MRSSNCNTLEVTDRGEFKLVDFGAVTEFGRRERIFMGSCDEKYHAPEEI